MLLLVADDKKRFISRLNRQKNWFALRDLVSFLQFKKRQKYHREVLLSVKLQALACIITKSNTPPLVFLTF